MFPSICTPFNSSRCRSSGGLFPGFRDIIQPTTSSMQFSMCTTRALPRYPRMQQTSFPVAPQKASKQQKFPQKGTPQYLIEKDFSDEPRPSVISYPNFDAESDCAKLKKALNGFIGDEKALIDIICRRSNEQRLEIVLTYKKLYDKSLLTEITARTKYEFQTLLIACLTPTIEFNCKEIYGSLFGDVRDKNVLIDLLCGLTNQEIRSINYEFKLINGKSLETTLKEDYSDDFKRFMASLAAANREESTPIDSNAAKADAKELKKAGCFNDESPFIRVFTTRNYDQLKLVCKEFQNLTGRPMENEIMSSFKGDVQYTMLTILQCGSNPAHFYANRIYDSFTASRVDHGSMIRLVVTRCELDMIDIKETFQQLYGKSLKSFIKDNTSGDYKRALCALIGEI